MLVDKLVCSSPTTAQGNKSKLSSKIHSSRQRCVVCAPMHVQRYFTCHQQLAAFDLSPRRAATSYELGVCKRQICHPQRPLLHSPGHDFLPPCLSRLLNPQSRILAILSMVAQEIENEDFELMLKTSGSRLVIILLLFVEIRHFLESVKVWTETSVLVGWQIIIINNNSR